MLASELERDEVIVALAMSAADSQWGLCSITTAAYLLERRGHEGPFITYESVMIARRGFLARHGGSSHRRWYATRP